MSHSARAPRRRCLLAATVTTALAAGLVVPSGAVAGPATHASGDVDSGADARAAATIPPDATVLVEELDERLVDAPITDGPAADAIDALAGVDRELAEMLDASAGLQAREDRLQEAIDELTATEQQAAAELADAVDRKRRLAAAAYTQDPAATRHYAILDASGPVEVARRGRLADTVGDTLNEAADEADELRAAASEGAAKVGDELVAVRSLRDDLDATIAGLLEQRAAARDEVAETLPMATVADLDIPLVVLNAYLRAERAALITEPGCGVPWWALAGIGRTESDHGRFRDSEPDEEGNVSPPILGVPLDGKGVAAIGDSDGGDLDQDTVHDRAVGPMQFIPSTWERWGSDGNGDDLDDPQNIYDAAYSAARYLCAVAHGDLTDDAQLDRAFLGYNHSLSYVVTVRDRAEEYRDRADYLPPLDVS